MRKVLRFLGEARRFNKRILRSRKIRRLRREVRRRSKKAGGWVVHYWERLLYGMPSPVVRDWDYMPSAVEFKPGAPPFQTSLIAFYFARYVPKQTGKTCHAAERSLAMRHGIKAFCYVLEGSEAERDFLQDATKTSETFAFCCCVATALPILDELAKALQSSNYLRLEGRALLLVGKAAIEPGFAATARCWREYCRSHDLGELLIVLQARDAGLQSDSVDAAISWIPRSSTPSPARIETSTASFVWRSDREISRSDMPFFQVVACREEYRISDANAGSAEGIPAATYQELLEKACRRASVQPDPTKDIVFIDGWNGSPASLAPSDRYGYAYLNATSKALQAVDFAGASETPRIGVIVHAFYSDIWHEIRDHLRTWQVPFRLYLSVPEGRYGEATAQLQKEFPGATVIEVPNRGRDIAPFLVLAKTAISDGMDILCKVHTKRSAHLSNGEEWRRDLLRKVLGWGDYPQSVVSAFQENPAIGLIIPQGHATSAARHWGANRLRVLHLAKRIRYRGLSANFVFPAGSMFWIRADALRPILELDLGVEDFEQEAGQDDGTLAHALERFLPLAAKLRGYRTVDTRILYRNERSDQSRSDLELAVMREPVMDYRFMKPRATTSRKDRRQHRQN